MKETEFAAIEPAVSIAEEKFDAFLESSDLQVLKDALQKASALLPENMGLLLNCSIEVWDDDRNKSISLLEMGISADCDGPPYRSTGGASPHRYKVNGDVYELPHSQCPVCWADWTFKHENQSCPACGVTMGGEVKILLDKGKCYWCGDGEVSEKNLACSKCGKQLEDAIVAWG